MVATGSISRRSLDVQDRRGKDEPGPDLLAKASAWNHWSAGAAPARCRRRL